ncbi:MAG: hypothetical protein NVS2B16_36180 [Chloroflexota bacterium]
MLPAGRDRQAPGDRVRVGRTFRDRHTEIWWALEVQIGHYGPERRIWAVVATTDSTTLPEHGTWYRAIILPAPGAVRVTEEAGFQAADLRECASLDLCPRSPRSVGNR